MQTGDVVVMGSDGLFDNLWDADLERLVLAATTSETTGQPLGERALLCLANDILSLAEANSQDKMFKSPWSVECAEQRKVGLLRKMFPKGGKLDDITVVVACVQAEL